MIVGLVGAGFIAEMHLRAWAKLGVTVHAYSRSHSFPNARVAETHRTLQSLVEAVDTVDICTPTFTHKEIAVTAFQSGCHVICEKPLSLTTDDARAMAVAAVAADRLLCPAHVVRYDRQYHAISRAINQGAIGEPQVIRLVRESSPPHRLPQDWIFDSKKSGGLIMDLMIHDIDYALHVAGPLSRVYAATARVAANGYDDHAFAILTHVSGAISHLTASWAQIEPKFKTSIDIAGTEGLITSQNSAASSLELNYRLAGVEETNDSTAIPYAVDDECREDPITNELLDFLSAIEGKYAPRVSAQDGVEAVQVAAAAQRSSLSGTSVEVGVKG